MSENRKMTKTLNSSASNLLTINAVNQLIVYFRSSSWFPHSVSSNPENIRSNVPVYEGLNVMQQHFIMLYEACSNCLFIFKEYCLLSYWFLFLFLEVKDLRYTWKNSKSPAVAQRVCKTDFTAEACVKPHWINTHTQTSFMVLPRLAMRPATVNWMESLAAPLPLFFHCSSLSLRIFILSASDILAPTSMLDFCWNIYSVVSKKGCVSQTTSDGEGSFLWDIETNKINKQTKKKMKNVEAGQ